MIDKDRGIIEKKSERTSEEEKVELTEIRDTLLTSDCGLTSLIGNNGMKRKQS
jgi:hypothetical protein